MWNKIQLRPNNTSNFHSSLAGKYFNTLNWFFINLKTVWNYYDEEIIVYIKIHTW